MPVKPNYSQKEPSADGVVWRFMDLRKFRDLMAGSQDTPRLRLCPTSCSRLLQAVVSTPKPSIAP